MASRRFPASITRRDFVNGALAAAVTGLAAGLPGCRPRPDFELGPPLPDDWYGPGGVGDYRLSHGNTPEATRLAHALRDGAFAAVDRFSGAEEEVDLVVVGCGFGGLGAALEASKRLGGASCLMLDNHPVFGGVAKENELEVDGVTLLAPQGSNGFFVPPAVDDPESATGDARYYAELGIPRQLDYAAAPADEKALAFCKDNYGYLVIGLQEALSVGHHFRAEGEPGGRWVRDLFRGELADAPLAEETRRSLLAWYRAGAARRFPDDDAARRFLDTMSYEQFLTRELGLGPEGARYADLFLASAVGLGSDAVSAYAAWKLPMPGLSDPVPAAMERHSFPGGNSGFLRHFVKALLPDAIEGGASFDDVVTGRIDFAALDRPENRLRMRLGATVVAVAHEGSPDGAERVRVVYARDGRLHVARARAVVLATGAWMNRHVVRDLPAELDAACRSFRHAPYLVAHVALTNWRFLHRLGITAAIWERTEGGFGRTCNLRQPMQVGRHRPPLDPERPAVLSFYTPFDTPGAPIDDQLRQGRLELLSTSFPVWERRILAQMRELFAASGFDPGRDVAGLVLNRWGHAFSVPYPGFFGGAGDAPAPRDLLRAGYGRVAFAHSELDGHQHWGPAADEGRRAVGQLAERCFA
ncbi:MAG TPA: NAD(P)-binding protein [Thermoanaerobaculia bacterium]|nr:NAD(P)-binding protein [Thermoanaerobaculia bacterium]